MAQWMERQTRDRKVTGSNLLQERQDNFLLQGPLSVLTLTSVSVPLPCYSCSPKKKRKKKVILPKVQVAGYS